MQRAYGMVVEQACYKQPVIQIVTDNLSDDLGHSDMDNKPAKESINVE